MESGEAPPYEAEGSIYPVSAVAKLLNLSERRVQQLTKDGIIPRAERGRYDLAAAVQGYVNYLQDRLTGNPDTHEGNDVYQAERTRKIAAEASMAEMELAKARGEMVELRIVTGELDDALVAIVARLGAVGAKVAPLLTVAKDTAERRALIDDAINEALHDISSPGFGLFRRAAGPITGSPAEIDPGDASTEAGADGEPVG